MRKKIILGISALAVVALAIWTATRWDAWFSEPEELPYSVAVQPHRVLLTFGDASPLSRNVSWQCDTAVRESFLELMSLPDSAVSRIPASGEVFASRAGKAAYYHARMRNLKPGARYAYRVTTGDATSQWYRFKVTDPDSGKLTFIYTGDVQDTVGGISGKMLREAFRRFPDAAFLVCAGDLVERPTDKDWGTAFELLDTLAATVPILNATGNHDYLKRLPKKLERRFPLVFSYFLESATGDNMTYTLKYGDTQFFLLDSNREFPYLWQQRNWLKQQLEASTATWKILVIHHPIHSIRTNHFFVKNMFEPLIDEYGVDLVLQGHEHNYARGTGHDGQGPLYLISNLAPKNYSVKKRSFYDLIDEGHRYLQLITITPTILTLTTYCLPTFTKTDSYSDPM